MLTRILLAGTAAVALLCSATIASAQTPKRGGTLTYAIETEPPSLDCHQEASFTVLALARPMYSNLIRFDQNNYPTLAPDLAESWTVSPDGMTYTFKLRQNVRFHDGSPFAAADVKATFDRIRNPPAGIVSQRKLDFEDVASIDTPDANTVVFRLARPTSSLLDAIASPFNCVYSARKLAENQRYPVDQPMGTGPFSFVSYQRGSERIAKRNEAYFRPGLPYLDGLRVLVMASSSVGPSLEGGLVDAIFRPITPGEAENMKRTLGDKIAQESTGVRSQLMFTINTTKKPFDDVRVRRALSLALDRTAAMAAVRNSIDVSSVGGILRPGYEYALSAAELEKMPGFGRDIEASRAEARRLLAEAGVPNLKLHITNRNIGNLQAFGVVGIDQWRRVGIEATQDLRLAPPIHIERTGKGDFELTVEPYVSGGDDPTLTFPKYLPGSPSNNGRFNDPMLADLFQKQKAELDRSKRREYVDAFQRRVLGEAYILPMYYLNFMPGLRSYIKGWKVTSDYNVGYEMTDVWLDK